MSFLFERDFDQEIEAEIQAGLPPAGPTGPDPALLEAIRREAFAQGLAQGTAEGLAQGRAEAEDSLLAQSEATLAAILPQIEALRHDLHQHQRLREQDLARMVLFLAERLLPEVAETFTPRRVLAFCRQAARMAEGEGGMILTLAPEMLEALRPHLPATTTQGAPLELRADADMAAGQAQATWAKGRADMAADRLHGPLLTLLTTLAQETAPARS